VGGELAHQYLMLTRFRALCQAGRHCYNVGCTSLLPATAPAARPLPSAARQVSTSFLFPFVLSFSSEEYFDNFSLFAFYLFFASLIRLVIIADFDSQGSLMEIRLAALSVIGRRFPDEEMPGMHSRLLPWSSAVEITFDIHSSAAT
jgi:hypothetical protein